MDEALPTVASELYEEKNYISDSKPTNNKKNVVSKFYFTAPPKSPKIDDDGDLIIERKTNKNLEYCIEIEHSSRTILDLVGLQVWRGALLLADWLIYNNQMFNKDTKMLELGSGVGLTSIVAATCSPVICTDISLGGILDLIKDNIKRNISHIKHPVDVKELDFTVPLTKEIENILPDIKIILAADVIYDDRITEAFVKTLYALFERPPNRTAYIALEKRYVFQIDDLMTGAPCYDHFVTCLNELYRINGIRIEAVPLEFPQYFDYDRVKELVLWKISTNF